MDKYDFSLVLACYNEAQIFKDSVKRIINTLNKTDFTWEIIFVDDQSQDDTVSLIKKAIKKYPRHHLSAYYHKKNQGRGQTVKDGFLKAQGKIVGYIDIDLEVSEWYLPKFIDTVDSGVDVASAWRIYDFNLLRFHRWLASKGYVWLRKLILGLPSQDTEGGYKFFKRNKIMPLINQSTYSDWFFDTEIMALCFQYHFKVVEIPVAFVRRLDKTSTVRFITDSLRYLINLIKFSQHYHV